jgi:hypothetical protein
MNALLGVTCWSCDLPLRLVNESVPDPINGAVWDRSGVGECGCGRSFLVEVSMRPLGDPRWKPGQPRRHR